MRNLENFTLKPLIAKIIFASKWFLLPFYLRLFWTLILLTYYFFSQGSLSNEHIISVLEAIDIVMIANLVKMVITGSYGSFVDKNHGMSGDNLSSGMLKIKITTSIIGVASIQLLQSFINASNILTETIHKQIIIYAAFLASALALSVIDYLHCKTEKH